LAALRVTQPDHEPLTIDVLGRQGQCLVEPQTERIDAGERHAPHRVTHRLQYGAHFARAQDDRQALRFVHAQEIEDLPVALQRANEEEAQRTHGNVDAGGRELLVLTQVQKVRANVVVSQ